VTGVARRPACEPSTTKVTKIAKGAKVVDARV
jgi:hypothetical protein